MCYLRPDMKKVWLFFAGLVFAVLWSSASTATKLGLAGERVSYVPALQDVLFHTRLLEPTKSETIYFTAPDQPGEYPYICTFPGHYLAMRGVLVVTR